MNKLVLILIIISILLFSLYTYDDNLKISFLDVGQGDAILIRTPQGQNILIDGGPDNVLLSELAKVLPWWERDIDYLVITHYHADHMMGFIEVLNKYKVKNILVTAHQPDDFLYQVWNDKLSERNIQPTIVKAGDKFIVSDDLYWQVILADSDHEDYNDNSLVIKLSYKNKDFMFTGDLSIAGEEKIISSGIDISAEYLKVGHHGSRYSSSDEFLKAVNPQFCIIQSGVGNDYGHPHSEALSRLENIGCQIMNTQNLGTLNFSF